METANITKEINTQFNCLFSRSISDGRNVTKPNICGVCDEFITLNDIHVISYEVLKETFFLIGKEQGNLYHDGCCDYHFKGEQYDSNVPWEKMFLSPGTQITTRGNNSLEEGIMSCGKCQSALRKNTCPQMAIANGFYFGNPPECLTCLTDIERAFLSPVKTFGFCFSYTGGFQKELKGSLSYYRVNISSIIRTAAHFQTLGMSDNIVILLYGSMTREQKQKAMKKKKLRTRCLLAAITWLCENNCEWKKEGVDIDTIASRLKNPTLIDNSVQVEGAVNSNIEQTESIQIFFPDTTIDVCTGGQETIKDFKLLVQEAKSQGYNFELQADLLRESVWDYRENNFVNTCLVQFPYGCGGLREERMINEKKGHMDIETYASHLSRISRPQFNEELFVLVLYNMKMRTRMMKGANWRVRQQTTATLLATELTEEDIDIAVRNRQAGTQSNGTGDQFLKAVDAIARGVAHTNEATKRARRSAECLQHHFGMPTHFLTVTPDDDNCILLQVYSQTDIDINSSKVDDMDDIEINNHARERTELRIKFPGIAAIVFEDMLNIIINTVIGWDAKTQTGKIGLFGTSFAFTCTVEEQGRRTLHAHFQIWIKETYEARQNLFSEHRYIYREAKHNLCKEADRTMSNTFLFHKRDVSPNHIVIFPHECSVPANRRNQPLTVTDQTLRELRYKNGNETTGKMFATCPHCPKSWDYEAFVKDYLLHNVKDAGYVACEGEGDFMVRMKAKTVDYQKQVDQNSIRSYVIEAGYNLHRHTMSCFKKAKVADYSAMTNREKKNARKRIIECECRYRLPNRKKRKTLIVNACDEKVKWYDWRGTYKIRNIKELILKRGVYDLFQNQSCPAIGESKMSCNTNINMVFHGSTGQYAFKYCTKATQEDERAEFDRVMDQKDRILHKIPRPDSDRSEATRRLLVASFAHQKSNVIGAPMSSYLTRNEERFIFSHPTTWMPLRDMKSLLNNRYATNSSIIYHGKIPIFQNIALHYLTRPTDLETMCAFDFFANYEVIRISRKNADSLINFHNTDYFTHPSYRENSNKFLQGVRRRHQYHLPKVYQFDFPDTAEFGGDILQTDIIINNQMETYAELAMLLFLPFRSLDDIQLNGSFVLKLRTVKHVVETRKDFLNNLNDAKANCFRIVRMEDDLQRNTNTPEHVDNEEPHQNWQDEEPEEVNEQMQGIALDNFLDEIDRELLEENANTEPNHIPNILAIKHIKDKGKKQCGYKELCHFNIPSSIPECNVLIQTANRLNDDIENEPPNVLENISAIKDKVSKHDIVRILIERTHRITRSFNDITGCSDNIEVMEANGSVKSIFDWANKANLDRQQRRAFEVIIGHFLLTFIQDVITSTSDARGDRHHFLKHKKQIYKLIEKTPRTSVKQTICLLYGPGGSGKTTVIDLIIEYAKEYCSFIDGVEFNSRTIVVTALTGVAATIIRGETTHAAVYLNQKVPIKAEQIELWTNTRLLIVDEISFASKSTFIELDNKLRKLRSRPDCAYGGLSIIFSGDFRQLEPVGAHQKPIYMDGCPQFTDWINCFLELEGMHRFKDDPEWGLLLRRFRDGQTTLEDIDVINSRVISPSDELPLNIRYATYTNRDRDAINAALFEQRCNDLIDAGLPLDDSIMILCDKQSIKNGSNVFVKFKNPKKMWEECSEDDVKVSQGSHRMDPVLRIYNGCRVMLPHNQDVRNGLANGTQANVLRVILHQGVIPNEVMINDRCRIKTVVASQVESVELEHVNERINPRIFSVKPRQQTFKINMKKPHLLQTKNGKTELLQMKATQIPILVNNATTVHKLQGSTLISILVNSFTIVKNWVYVVLSRIRTISGLYLKEPLDSNLSIYAVPAQLLSMINRFREKFCPTMWNDEEYEELFRD